MKISHLFLAAITAALASASFGYVREFDNGIPLAWVKDRTVVMQLSLGPRNPHPAGRLYLV